MLFVGNLQEIFPHKAGPIISQKSKYDVRYSLVQIWLYLVFFFLAH